MKTGLCRTLNDSNWLLPLRRTPSTKVGSLRPDFEDLKLKSNDAKPLLKLLHERKKIVRVPPSQSSSLFIKSRSTNQLLKPATKLVVNPFNKRKREFTSINTFLPLIPLRKALVPGAKSSPSSPLPYPLG